MASAVMELLGEKESHCHLRGQARKGRHELGSPEKKTPLEASTKRCFFQFPEPTGRRRGDTVSLSRRHASHIPLRQVI